MAFCRQPETRALWASQHAADLRAVEASTIGLAALVLRRLSTRSTCRCQEPSARRLPRPSLGRISAARRRQPWPPGANARASARGRWRRLWSSGWPSLPALPIRCRCGSVSSSASSGTCGARGASSSGSSSARSAAPRSPTGKRRGRQREVPNAPKWRSGRGARLELGLARGGTTGRSSLFKGGRTRVATVLKQRGGGYAGYPLEDPTRNGLTYLATACPPPTAQNAFLKARSQVLVAKPFSADGRELPSSVLKYDQQAVVEAEAALMEEHGRDWGATSSRGTGLSTRSEPATFTAKGALAASSPSTFLARPAVVPGNRLSRYPHVQDLVIQDGWALMSPRDGRGPGGHVAERGPGAALAGVAGRRCSWEVDGALRWYARGSRLDGRGAGGDP